MHCSACIPLLFRGLIVVFRKGRCSRPRLLPGTRGCPPKISPFYTLSAIKELLRDRICSLKSAQCRNLCVIVLRKESSVMPGSLHLGKIAGIDIYIHFSWLIIFVFLTWSLATGWFPQLYPGWSTATYWLGSAVAALLLFVSVLLHEFAHSFVPRLL